MTRQLDYNDLEQVAAWLARRGEGCCEASGSPFHPGPCVYETDDGRGNGRQPAPQPSTAVPAAETVYAATGPDSGGPR